MFLAPDEQEAPFQRAQREQEWAKISSELHAESASILLQTYFTELSERVPSWELQDFLKGIDRFARLWGSERAKTFPNKFSGLHSPHSFAKVWNETQPEPLTAFDLNIRLQCPSGWVCRTWEGRFVMVYDSNAPLSQGLNELVCGPSTLDCGMYCQLIIWMRIRYLLGDKLFDTIFNFGRGQFILTQKWYAQMNKAGTLGNLLYHIYDDPRNTATLSLPTPRIETRAFFNHPSYLNKHPGGTARLENVTQVSNSSGDGDDDDDDSCYIVIFDPKSQQNILSKAELDQTLRQAFDSPQDFADFEKLEINKKFPESVRFFDDQTLKTAEAIAKEAHDLATYIMTDTEGEASKGERNHLARGLRLVLNFPRLISCLQEIEEVHRNGETGYNTLDCIERAVMILPGMGARPRWVPKVTR